MLTCPSVDSLALLNKELHRARLARQRRVHLHTDYVLFLVEIMLDHLLVRCLQDVTAQRFAICDPLVQRARLAHLVRLHDSEDLRRLGARHDLKLNHLSQIGKLQVRLTNHQDRAVNRVEFILSRCISPSSFLFLLVLVQWDGRRELYTSVDVVVGCDFGGSGHGECDVGQIDVSLLADV